MKALDPLRRCGLAPAAFLGVILFACSAAQPAQADVLIGGRALHIMVRAGATCLDASRLQSELQRRSQDLWLPAGIEVDVVGSSDDPRNIVLRVREQGGWESVRIFSPAPERCEDLHQTLAISLVLALKAALEPVEAAEIDSAEQTTRAPGSRRALALSLAPLFATQVAGSVSGGASAYAAVVWPHASIRLGGFGLHALQEQLRGGERYRLSLIAAQLELCGGWPVTARWSLAACLGPMAGGMLVGGPDVVSSTRPQRRWLAAGLGLELARALSQGWFVRAAAGAIGALHAQPLIVHDQTGMLAERRSLPRLGGSFLLGFEYRFASAAPSFARARTRALRQSSAASQGLRAQAHE